MSWLSKAKNVEASLVTKREQQLRQQEEALAEFKRKEEEHYPLIKVFSPRVEKVCKAFARSIKGKLVTKAPYWGKSGAPRIFEIKNRNGEITIELNEWNSVIQGISVSAVRYTEEFYNKCPKHSTHENFPVSQFYRFLEPKGDGVFLWAVCYNIPYWLTRGDGFEDELATVLETLCYEMQEGNARTHPY